MKSWCRMAAMVVVGCVVSGRGAAGQGMGVGSVPSLAPSPAVQSMAMMSAMSSPGVTDAAGATVSGNMFNNPMAAPLLYGSMQGSTGSQDVFGMSAAASATGLSPMQFGMMMMMSNPRNGGVGSGRLSGARGNPQQRATSRPVSSEKARAVNRPGGLASRYFSRTVGRPSAPRGYFSRRPNYFP